MSRWFRLYDEMLDDPKVQRLHPALFKVLVNLWCVASRNDGRLPAPADLSFALRLSEDETFRAVSKLADAGFIDTDTATGEQRPHGWDTRQYRSDVSTDRVRAHREAKKTAKNDGPPSGGKAKKAEKRNVDETFHATAPETEADTDNSVANATGTVVPHPAADFCKAIFDSGVALLTATGASERNARSLLGRLRQKLNDDPAMLTILREAEIKQVSEPAEWLSAAVENRCGTRKPNPASGVRGARPDPSLDMLRAARAAQADADPADYRGDHRQAGTALPAVWNG